MGVTGRYKVKINDEYINIEDIEDIAKGHHLSSDVATYLNNDKIYPLGVPANNTTYSKKYNNLPTIKFAKHNNKLWGGGRWGTIPYHTGYYINGEEIPFVEKDDCPTPLRKKIESSTFPFDNNKSWGDVGLLKPPGGYVITHTGNQINVKHLDEDAISGPMNNFLLFIDLASGSGGGGGAYGNTVWGYNGGGGGGGAACVTCAIDFRNSNLKSINMGVGRAGQGGNGSNLEDDVTGGTSGGGSFIELVDKSNRVLTITLTGGAGGGAANSARGGKGGEGGKVTRSDGKDLNDPNYEFGLMAIQCFNGKNGANGSSKGEDIDNKVKYYGESFRQKEWDDGTTYNDGITNFNILHYNYEIGSLYDVAENGAYSKILGCGGLPNWPTGGSNSIGGGGGATAFAGYESCGGRGGYSFKYDDKSLFSSNQYGYNGFGFIHFQWHDSTEDD